MVERRRMSQRENVRMEKVDRERESMSVCERERERERDRE